MSDIKQKALAKGKEFGLHLGYANKLEEYTDFVIDLAIAERNNELIDKVNEYADIQSDKDIAMGIRGMISLIKD